MGGGYMLKVGCVSILVLLFVICGYFAIPAFSQGANRDLSVRNTTPTIENRSRFRSIEFLTGYGLAKLHEKGSYRTIPLFVDLNFDLKPQNPNQSAAFPGLLQLVLEPFLSYVYAPDNNMETGANLLLKVGFLPETSKFQPYFKGGFGFIYMSQRTKEQGTKLNFDECAAVGMQYSLSKSLALTLEYRFRHISNAGLHDPNHGINTNFTLCGVSYSF